MYYGDGEAKPKISFPFLFRFAAEGWGEEAREKCKEIFWFLHTRVRERVRGALVRFTTQSERTRQFQATTRFARAISRSQDSTQNTFELCPINTAIVYIKRELLALFLYSTHPSWFSVLIS